MHGQTSMVNQWSIIWLRRQKKTFFLESVATHDQSHNAQWIAEDLARVIDAQVCDVAGAVTDNTSTNKAAWKLLERRYPGKFFHGCVSHALHFVNSPFEDLIDFASKSRDIVVFFKNHHAFNHTLKKMQNEAKLQGLVLPAPTRWGSLLKCFESLLDSEQLLFSIVNSRDFIANSPTNQRQSRIEIKGTIINANFVKNLEKAVTILKPIDEYISKVQNDAVPASEVYVAFLDLPTKFVSATEILDKREISFIKKLIDERFQFIYGDAHGLGYLLDPRFVGEKLDRKLRQELEDLLLNLATNENEVNEEENKREMYSQLKDYIISANDQKQRKSFKYKMLIEGTKTSLEYWLTDGYVWPILQKVSLRIFTLAVSSASSERNFSTFGFIHSKLRNQLSEDTVKKLVFVKTNANQLSLLSPVDDTQEDNCDLISHAGYKN